MKLFSSSTGGSRAGWETNDSDISVVDEGLQASDQLFALIALFKRDQMFIGFVYHRTVSMYSRTVEGKRRTSFNDHDGASFSVLADFMRDRSRKSEPGISSRLENRLHLRDVAGSFWRQCKDDGGLKISNVNLLLNQQTKIHVRVSHK